MISATLVANPPRFRSPALQRRLTTPRAIVAADRGTIVVWVVGRVIVTSGSGHGTTQLAQRWLALLDTLLAEGATEVWHDWAQLGSYDSSARTLITEWTATHRAFASHIHILVGSKLMSMGLTVASLLLRSNINSYSGRVAFEDGVLTRIAAQR